MNAPKKKKETASTKSGLTRLTLQHKSFAEKLLCDPFFDATKVYKEVFSTPTDAAASSGASRLLKDPLFQRHLAALMKQREKRTQVTQDAIIEEFRRVAFANITDVAEWQKGDVQFRASTDISPDVTPAIAEVSSTWTENGRQLKVKMHPKMDALKVLAQHVGLTMPMQTAISSLRRYGIYLNQKEDGTYELLDVYQSAAQDSLEDFDDEDLLGESALDEDELEDELTEE